MGLPELEEKVEVVGVVEGGVGKEGEEAEPFGVLIDGPGGGGARRLLRGSLAVAEAVGRREGNYGHSKALYRGEEPGGGGGGEGGMGGGEDAAG